MIILVPLIIAFIVSTLFCGISRLAEGSFPTWYFWLFMSWWWPFRSESAATILAANIRGDTYSDWREYSFKEIKNSKIDATVSDFCGTISATLGRRGIPLNEWDRFVLARAMKLFRKGAVGSARKDAAIKAAEAIINAYRDKGSQP